MKKDLYNNNHNSNYSDYRPHYKPYSQTTGNIQDKKKTREKEVKKPKKDERKPLIDASDEELSAQSSSDSKQKELTDSKILDEVGEPCPITLEVPKKAVVASDGHTYEEKEIKPLAEKGALSPITREPLTPTLIPNLTYAKQLATTVRIAKEKEEEKKKRKKVTKKRTQDREEFELEMRRMMEEARQERAEMRQEIAQLKEHNEALEVQVDEIDARIRANEAKARRAYQAREEYLKANAVDQAWDDLLIAFGVSSATTLATGVALGIEAGIATAAGATPWAMVMLPVGAGAAAAATAPMWAIVLPVAIVVLLAVPGTVFLVSYIKHRYMDDREFERDKPLVDRVLQDAMQQQNLAQAMTNMQNLEQQHQFTLPGLATTILYAIVEVGVSAYQQILQLRGGTEKERDRDYQVQYITTLHSEIPLIAAAENHPVRQRIRYISEHGAYPTADQVAGPHKLPDSLLIQANDAIKAAEQAPKEMSRSSMASLPRLALSSVSDTVTKGGNNPDFEIVFKKGIVLEKEFLREKANNAKVIQ